MAVIEATKTPKAVAPTASEVVNPSTTDSASQSLALPSVRAAASTISPIMSVRGSVHAASARRRVPGESGPCASVEVIAPSGR